MCYSGCEYENYHGECKFVSRHGEPFPCAEFECAGCGEEITVLDLKHNDGKCPHCGYGY